MYLTRNQAMGQPIRGFESHPLRQYPRIYAVPQGVWVRTPQPNQLPSKCLRDLPVSSGKSLCASGTAYF